MLPSPDIFDPARTHCPSCNATLNALVDSCAFCGFNAQICVQRFPFAPPSLTRFVDPDNAITSRERKKLTRAIRKIERRFPQITVTVASMALPENVDGREFGYWFLNRSAVEDEQERRQRLHHLLALVDRRSQTVTITVGYGLDCFLDDQLLYASLERTSAVFANRGFASGICALLKRIGDDLLSVHKDATYAHDRWERHLHHAPGDEAPTQQLPTISQGYHEVREPRPAEAAPRQQLPAVPSHEH